MRAACWHGTHDIRVDNVPDPIILDKREAIIRITTTAICSSDLHIHDGFIPTMEKGDVMSSSRSVRRRAATGSGTRPQTGAGTVRDKDVLLRFASSVQIDGEGEWHDWELLIPLAEKLLDHGQPCRLLVSQAAGGHLDGPVLEATEISAG